MDKKTLSGYRKDKKELTAVEKTLARLEAQLENVPTVMGKVSMSSHTFPYVESHMAVQMAKPKECDRLSKRIREKEKRRDVLLVQIASVEKFIGDIPEGIDKEIFEMVFLDGMTQKEAGDILGYTKGRISQIISSRVKD